jgi:methylamine dehydrogenase accessory protein MauD
MLTALIISQVISWLLIIGLGVALLALARQVGVLHVRVAPAGALTTAGGPAVGDKSPHIDAIALDGRSLTIGGKLSGGTMRLLMFVSAQCPLCKGLIPVAKSFARDERVDLVFVGDDTVGAQHALIERFGLDAYPFVNGPETGTKFGVEKLPYAVLLDDNGTVLSKGLVNSREHLESLVIAHEMGVKSVQDYISGIKSTVAA